MSSEEKIPVGLKGTYYKAKIPDTLDLTQHAAYGINHFTSIISEDHGYEMYWGTMNLRGLKTTLADGQQVIDAMGHPGEDHVGADFGECNPPIMHFMPFVLQACQPKAFEGLAMLRVATGSKQNLEKESKMVEMMVSTLGKEDGLYWVPNDDKEKKPWLGPNEYRPYVNVHGVGRMLRAMMTWYQYTEDPAWKERVDKMIDGIDRLMVVHKGDYAYFPVEGWIPIDYFRSGFTKRGWRDTSEPINEKKGNETSLFNHQGHVPEPLANWYVMTGNKQALRLAGELVRFLMQPKFWADFGVEYPDVFGPEHAHWQGHGHGHYDTLRAILAYANATNDSRLKQFVRDGYEWSRQAGLTRIGFAADGQGCACARLTALAIKLTETGVGDYWEDIDLYIRNHGVELQFVPEDIPFLKALGEGKPPHAPGPDITDVGVIEANIGAFTGDTATKRNSGACCSDQGNLGIFYVWDSIIRQSDDTVRVNLLLNRASPWMDVDSYIPYEGKVVLKNKTAKEALVRLPLWVEKGAVVSSIGDRKVKSEWFGNYLRLSDLKPDDVATITFPMREWTEKWTSVEPRGRYYPILNTVYTIKLRGNTVVEITPPLLKNSWLYHGRAERYKPTVAPMRETTRFVSPKVLKW